MAKRKTAQQPHPDPASISVEDCPYYLVSRATLAVTSALKERFTRGGIVNVRPAYLGVLMSLWQQDGIKVNELGQRAGLEPSTMTGLIDRMERDGLVERTAHQDDRRAQKIHLTSQGRGVRQAVLAIIEETLADVLRSIPKKEMAVTKGVLRRIIGNAHEVVS